MRYSVDEGAPGGRREDYRRLGTLVVSLALPLQVAIPVPRAPASRDLARHGAYLAMDPTSLSHRSSRRLRSADVPYFAKS